MTGHVVVTLGLAGAGGYVGPVGPGFQGSKELETTNIYAKFPESVTVTHVCKQGSASRETHG